MRTPQTSVAFFLLLFALAIVLGYGVAMESVVAMAIVPVLVAAVTAVLWPAQTLLCLVVYIPLESFLLKWVSGGLGGVLSLAPEVILFVAAVSALLRGSKSADTDARMRWVLWLGVFLAAGALSTFIGGTRIVDGLYWLRTHVRYMSAAVVVGSMGNRQWWTDRFAPAVASGVVVQSAIATIQLVLGAPANSFFAPASVVVAGREFVDYGGVASGISGTLGFYNNFGLFSALSGIVCAGAFISQTERDTDDAPEARRYRTLLAVASIAAALSVLMSGSRQALLVLGAGVIVVLFTIGLRRLGSRVVPLVFGISVFVLAAALLPQLAGPLNWIPERFQQAVAVSTLNQSLQSDRLFAVARVVPAVMALNPLTGLGPGALSSGAGLGTAAGELSLSSSGVSYVQDVGWAGVFVQMGILGVSLLFGLLVSLVRRARGLFRAGVFDRGAQATVLGAMAVWGIAMVASSPLLIRSVSLVLWSVAGLCLGGYKVLSRGSEEDA